MRRKLKHCVICGNEIIGRLYSSGLKYCKEHRRNRSRFHRMTRQKAIRASQGSDLELSPLECQAQLRLATDCINRLKLRLRTLSRKQSKLSVDLEYKSYLEMKMNAIMAHRKKIQVLRWSYMWPSIKPFSSSEK